MNKGVTWFKMFLSFAPLINAIPSQNVGEGVKAAMHYFKTGEEPNDLHEMTDAVYNMLKDSIDQAFTDCEERSEKARKSIMARWHGSDTTEYDRIRPNTEESQNKNQSRTEKTMTSDVDCGVLDEPAPPPPPASEQLVYTDQITGKGYTLREYMEHWKGIWNITDVTWKMVNRYRAKGMTDKLIRFAFDQTVNASPENEDAYFSRVLKDYHQAGFTTAEQAMAREAKRNKNGG